MRMQPYCLCDAIRPNKHVSHVGPCRACLAGASGSTTDKHVAPPPTMYQVFESSFCKKLLACNLTILPYSRKKCKTTLRWGCRSCLHTHETARTDKANVLRTRWVRRVFLFFLPTYSPSDAAPPADSLSTRFATRFPPDPRPTPSSSIVAPAVASTRCCGCKNYKTRGVRVSSTAYYGVHGPGYTSWPPMYPDRERASFGCHQQQSLPLTAQLVLQAPAPAKGSREQI